MDSLLLYQFVKTLHILSAVIITGTGFGTAFYLFVVNRSGSVSAQSVVSYWVCKADFWFTTPCVIFQPISGVWLMSKLGIPWSATWIWVSIGLYLFAGMLWLPVVWWQIQMKNIVKHACDTSSTLPQSYWRYAKKWELAGYPAFLAVVVIFFLMVIKPM